MIIVTRFNQSTFAVNPDLIERIQSSPDTTLMLVGGATYVVRETLEEVIEMIAQYRARVIATAHALSAPDIHLAAPPEPVDIADRQGAHDRAEAPQGADS